VVEVEGEILKKKTAESNIPDVRPPNPPWLPIPLSKTNQATLTFYYGDSKSLIIPIRDVSNRNDASPTLTSKLLRMGCSVSAAKVKEKISLRRELAPNSFVQQEKMEFAF